MNPMDENEWDNSEEMCPKCGTELFLIDCSECDESGCSHHDCGEDVCVCLNKENNITCGNCDGMGGWYWCNTCKKNFDYVEIQKGDGKDDSKA